MQPDIYPFFVLFDRQGLGKVFGVLEMLSLQLFATIGFISLYFFGPHQMKEFFDHQFKESAAWFLCTVFSFFVTPFVTLAIISFSNQSCSFIAGLSKLFVVVLHTIWTSFSTIALFVFMNLVL